MNDLYRDDKTNEYLIDDLEDLASYIHEFSTFLPLPVITVNLLGVVTDTNQAFEELVEVERNNVLGTHVIDLFREKKKFTTLEHKVLQGEVIKGLEMTLIARSKRVPVSAYIAPRKERGNNIIGYFIGIFDITKIVELTSGLEGKVKERTQALEKKTLELTKSKKKVLKTLKDIAEARKAAEHERDKTLAIIENMADGILIFDRARKILLINPKTCALLRLDRNKNLIGKSISELVNLQEILPLAKFLGKDIKKRFRERLVLTEDEVIEISVLPLTIHRSYVGKIVILHDITRETTVEKMKTDFVSIAAHQLRTPLTTIKWSLHFLLKRPDNLLKEEDKEFLEKIDQSTNRLINLVNYLLDVTRIEEGRFIFRSKDVDFIDIVKNVVAASEEAMKKKHISYTLHLPQTAAIVGEFDTEKISLVIQNLIENAVNYTPPNGIITISVELKKHKSQILFSITDTGIGIPNDSQKKIFNKFYRAENALRVQTEGSGLGLFISKNIIEGHGGRIWFNSYEDKGTTMYFTLPLINAKMGKKSSFPS